MKYPKYYNAQSYCRKILEEYKQEYFNLTSEEMKYTIGYIVSKISSIIEQTKEECLSKAIEWLAKIEQLTKEQCLDYSKWIAPVDAMSVLFGAIYNSDPMSNLIQNHMKFSVRDEHKINYLEFLRDMTIKCAKELAAINDPKQRIVKKVIFSEYKDRDSEKENIELQENTALNIKKAKINTI